jgi:hypothetical protein
MLLHDRQQTRGHLPIQVFLGEIPGAARGRGLRGDGDRLFRPDGHPGLDDLRANASGLHGLGLEDVPVGDEDAPLGQERHQVRRHKVPGAVQARLALLGLQLAQAIPDGHVGADDEHHVGEAPIAPVVDLIQDAPGGEHAHDGRLPATRGHLAGVAKEPGVALLPLLVAQLFPRHLDALAKVSARLDEEDDRLSRFALRVE